MQDEKDKRIQELSAELRVKKRLSAAYKEQLLVLMKDVDNHTDHLTSKVQTIRNNLKELEARREELPGHKKPSSQGEYHYIVLLNDLQFFLPSSLCLSLCFAILTSLRFCFMYSTLLGFYVHFQNDENMSYMKEQILFCCILIGCCMC